MGLDFGKLQGTEVHIRSSFDQEKEYSKNSLNWTPYKPDNFLNRAL